MKTRNDGNYPVAYHLGEAELISHLDGELSSDEEVYARTHLQSCWTCRSDLHALQEGIENFLRVRKQLVPTEIPPAGPALAQFRRRLSQYTSLGPPVGRQLASWLKVILPQRLFPKFALTYKKAIYATALAGLIVVFAISDPLNWNKVSADELLKRADANESLQLASKRIVHARVDIARVALDTKVVNKIGEIETMQDEQTSALYVSAHYASGVNRKELIPDRNKLENVVPFISDLSPAMTAYFNLKGWFPQVSIASYKRLIEGRASSLHDNAYAVRRGETYELHHLFAEAHGSGITECVLFVNAQTYAPESISIFTFENNQRYEYQLKRRLFATIERTPEVAKLFETVKIDTSLTPKAVAVTEADALVAKKLEQEELSALKIEPPAATVQLEVEVLGLVSQINADLGQEVIVTRLPQGTLKVEAVVDTQSRKNEILNVLSPVANHPALNLQIDTSLEVQQRGRNSRASTALEEATTTTAEVSNNSFAVQPQVTKYLRQRGIPQEQIDIEVGRIANQIVMRSHRAMLQVWALKSLLQRFSSADLKTLNAEGRTKWLEMIFRRAGEFKKESSLLYQEIGGILHAPSKIAITEREINDEAQLLQALTQLIAQASNNHEVIRSGFTVSGGGSSSSVITASQFWHSMSEAESTAVSIQSATQRLKLKSQ